MNALPRRFAAFVLAAATPLSTSALPQQPFRTTTVVVEVDTIVTDARGQFIADLTTDDFEVREDGKPQKIERLYLVDGTSARTVAAPGAPRESAGEQAAPAVPPRVFVLVFDQDHLQESSFKRVKDAALAFLQSEFKAGDIGGVVLGGAMIGNRLTSDREALMTAVRGAKPTATKTSRRVEMMEWPRLANEGEAVRIALSNDRDALAQAERRACQDDPAMCKSLDPEPMVMEKARTIVGELRPAARRTVMTLQALAAGLARVPGRKTIVLVSEGFFVEESWADLRQIVGAAARSNVRIYSLDARGVDTRQINDLRLQTPTDPGGGLPLETYNTAEDGPNMLAVDTGGRAFRHTNQFADALKEIARDTSRYYVLGYAPAVPAAEGSFHTIGVTVKRPGVIVRARRGYLASKAP
ncbi:MAG TPA: VWA domain-containing protein, partial [Vicinamibacterales bacterium]